jgi:hypothetical protein|tara:strand:+ start:1395 stop:2252 length:858 start_codon:yes stop_codon:yes gene_type:complete
MSKTDYLDVKVLVREMILGKIQINKPIIITSSDRTKTEELSFLSHVLKYNKVTKKTIFIFLNEVLNVFNNQLTKLMKNKRVQEYINNIKSQWEDFSDILFKDTITNDQIKLIEELIENINELCSKFKEINGNVESNNVTDVIEQDELVENMDVFVKSIKEFNENTDEITSGLNSYQGNLNDINMCVLLDLSMKNKQLYLDAFELDEDKTIPENIHNIFLNYIYILNLIKKQIIYYKKSIKKVQEIASNMKKHTVNTKMSVKSHDKLFMTQEQEKGIESYIDTLSE